MGHAKAFAEFSGGRAFASSTLTPAEVSLRSEGHYEGDVCDLGITLIFTGLPRTLLKDVFSEAVDDVLRQIGCLLIERAEV
ncbi:MAG: hypothetical protein U0411_15725 [Thermodesulfovibrionales bacterium]